MWWIGSFEGSRLDPIDMRGLGVERRMDMSGFRGPARGLGRTLSWWFSKKRGTVMTQRNRRSWTGWVVVLALVLLTTFGAEAQGEGIWRKEYKGPSGSVAEISDCVASPDGSYFANTGPNLIIAKLSPSGGPIWRKQYSCSTRVWDYFEMAGGSEGGACLLYHDTSFPQNRLLFLDRSGEIIRQVSLTYKAYPTRIWSLKGGGYLIAGFYQYSQSPLTRLPFLIKYGEDGYIARALRSATLVDAPGWAPKGCPTQEGGILIEGCQFDADLSRSTCWEIPSWTQTNDPILASDGGIFQFGGGQVLRCNSGGTPLWSVTLPLYEDDTHPNPSISSISFAPAPDGGLYSYYSVIYRISVDLSTWREILLRWDSQGNVQWARDISEDYGLNWRQMVNSLDQRLSLFKPLTYGEDITLLVPSEILNLPSSGNEWNTCISSTNLPPVSSPADISYRAPWDPAWVPYEYTEDEESLIFWSTDAPFSPEYACVASCSISCGADAKPISGPSPLAVDFSSLVTTGGCADEPVYAWDFGDGASSTEHNPSHTFTTEGVFTWTLTVTAEGETASVSGKVVTETPPTAVPAAEPSSGTIPLAVRFSAEVAGGTAPYEYTWDFKDGSATSSEVAPIHLFTAGGSYAVTLTIRDTDGKTAEGTVTVAVGQGEPTDLTVAITATPTGGAIPLAVAFAANAQGGTAPYTYDWDFGDGSAHSGDASPTHTYTSAGDFTATLFVIDADSHGVVATVIVRAAATLVVSAQATPTSGSTPLQVIFTSTVSGGTAPYTYAWDFGDGGTSALENPWYTYEDPGNFTATLTVRDGSGQVVSAAPLSLQVSQGLKAIASGTPLAGTVPLTVHFTGSAIGGTPPYGYSWDFGDGGTSVEQSPTHPYGAVGTYQAVLTVTDSQSLSRSSAPITVRVNAPLVITAGATPTVGSIPLTVQFTAAVSGGMEPYTVTWTFGDGSSGTGSSVSHTYTAMGAYTVTAKVVDGAGVTATDSHLTIGVTLPLTATVTGTPLTGEEPLSVSFTATASGGMAPYTYSWNFGDGSPADARPSPGHIFRKRGTYTVTFSLKDAFQQTFTSELTVTVTPAQPELLWRYTADTALLHVPTVGPDGAVYAGGSNSYVYAIGPNGNLLWKKKPGGVVMATMAFDRGNLYFPTSNQRLVAYSTGGGKIWDVKLDTNANCSAAVSDCGDVYLGTTGGTLYAVAPGGGVKWKFKTVGPIESTPAVGRDGIIYVVANDSAPQDYPATLYAFYPNGGIKWMAPSLLGFKVFLPLVLDGDDNIYVTDSAGTVTVVPPTKTTPPPDPRTYLWKASVGSASPVIAGGLLLYSGAGSTKTVQISDGADGPWAGDHGGAVAPAISADGKAYVIQNDDPENAYLVALDMADGTTLSQTRLAGATRDAALVTLNRKGRVVLITADYNVECYSVPRGGAPGPWVQYGGTSYHSARRSDVPTAFITSPADGSQVNGDVNVLYGGTVDQTCDGPKVNFYIEDFKAASAAVSPASFIWFTGASQDGPYTLTAECWDKAGNVVETSINVTLHNPAPPIYTTVDPAPTFAWQPMGDSKFRVYLSTDPEFGTILTKSKTPTKPWLKSPGWTPNKKQWAKVLAVAGASPVRVYWKAIGKDAGLVYLGSFTITH